MPRRKRPQRTSTYRGRLPEGSRKCQSYRRENADPHDAGDIVTAEAFGAFELQLDYNISEGGNSGIIYPVTNEGGATWATGPEFRSKALQPFCNGRVGPSDIPPVPPWNNGHSESFNKRLRKAGLK